ncbi:CPBP family intramembrane metalloprotease [Marinobacter salinexigens]|uniref:CPBP family intramembrane metalloprotease n=1 Tax=Marinobacter salinexigens TaxID=2919747 RepID=A0A5B0VD14_9GAMM|nr:CPBP family intramembrane glutamic endopeptidase [Marinobacter salinexigens]KAA1171929.1 CPBP family intramembrane metalloprotease [Marinobacter salinexigens]
MATGQRSSGLSARAALMFQGGIGLAGLGLIWLFAIPVQWDGLGLIRVVVFGALGAAITYLVLLLLSLVPGLFPDDLERQMRGLYHFARSFPWTVLAALSALAGVGEELLFRGAVQGWLTGTVGPWMALIVSAVLFGLVHYVSFTYFLVATGLGVVLGAAYHFSDSLALVMVWHGLYDMMALFFLIRFPHWFGIQNQDAR